MKYPFNMSGGSRWLNIPAGAGLELANQPKLDPWVMLEPLLFDRNVNQRMMVQDHVLLFSCVVCIPALVITGHLVPLCDISQVQSVWDQLSVRAGSFGCLYLDSCHFLFAHSGIEAAGQRQPASVHELPVQALWPPAEKVRGEKSVSVTESPLIYKI